jgi:hypothetical protein
MTKIKFAFSAAMVAIVLDTSFPPNPQQKEVHNV